METARKVLRRARRRRPEHVGLFFLGGAGAALAGFHLVLFVDRLRDLSILQPAIALQWLGAGLLLAFLAYLRSRGVSLLVGRTALAFWLLVLLLHVVPHVPAPIADGSGAEVLLALPSAWTALALGLAVLVVSRRPVALCVARPAARRRRRRRRPFESGFPPALFARPPPFSSR